MVSQSVGHLAQVLIMSAPLLLVLLDRLLVVQSGKAWLDGLLLGLLAWAQLLTGEEVLAMEAVTAAIAVAVALALSRTGRRGGTLPTPGGARSWPPGCSSCSRRRSWPSSTSGRTGSKTCTPPTRT